MRSNLFIKVPDHFNVFMMGDSQWGNVGVYENGIDRAFDMVHSEYRGCRKNFVFWMGDSIDAITINDPRFSLDVALPKLSFLRAQIDYAIERLQPIKQQLRVVLKGNHEHKWHSIYGDIGAEVAGKLGCEYGEYVCTPHLIMQKTDELMMRFFLHHGFGKMRSQAKDSLQAQANMMAALKNKLQSLFSGAVVMAMGHTHHLFVVPPDNTLQLVSEDGDIKQVYPDTDVHVNYASAIVEPEYRWYVNTGSFLRLYTPGSTGFAEMNGMKPVELGFAVACVRDRRVTKVYKEVV